MKLIITIVLILLLTTTLYYYIYITLNIPTSKRSLLCFQINIILLLLSTVSFILYLLFMDHAIYLKDISKLSQFRYLILIVIVLLIGILHIFNKAYKLEKIERTLSTFRYPYLKEQINEILDMFVIPYLANTYEFIFQKVYTSKYFKIMFFLLHFMTIYGIGFINTCIFVEFVFFNGDFRTILLLMPLNIFSMIMQNLNYNFTKYILLCMDESKKMFIVKVNSIEYRDIDYITILPKNIELLITDYGYSKGLSSNNMNFYLDKWVIGANFKYYFAYYNKKCALISKINFFIIILCWIIITRYFFFNHVS